MILKTLSFHRHSWYLLKILRKKNVSFTGPCIIRYLDDLLAYTHWKANGDLG